MEEKILEAVNFTYSKQFSTISEALGQYSSAEILDAVLRHEGIIGYTQWIIDVVIELGIEWLEE